MAISVAAHSEQSWGIALTVLIFTKRTFELFHYYLSAFQNSIKGINKRWIIDGSKIISFIRIVLDELPGFVALT
jgi:hypothetical protein